MKKEKQIGIPAEADTAADEEEMPIEIETTPPAEEMPAATVPFYMDKDWGGKVETFFSSYPIAKKYSHELASRLLEVKREEAQLEGLLIQILCEKLRDPEELLADTDFIDTKILRCPAIINRIKHHAAAALNERAAAPATILYGGSHPVAPIYKPKTLDEAAIMTAKLLSQL